MSIYRMMVSRGLTLTDAADLAKEIAFPQSVVEMLLGDLEAIRQEAMKRCGIPFGDNILASYPMYPDVFANFNVALRTYGPVSALPTPVYFYGMQLGDEIPVILQVGMTMIICLQALSETADPKQISASMPGIISAILIHEDQTVTQDEPLLGIEAMKMETRITALQSGTVKFVHVRVGEQLDAKDLVLELV